MIMSINLDYTEKICITCGCIYYVPSEVVRIRNEDKTDFYCFNGHAQRIIKSTSERLKEQYEEKLAQKERQLNANEVLINNLSNRIKNIEKPFENKPKCKARRVKTV